MMGDIDKLVKWFDSAGHACLDTCGVRDDAPGVCTCGIADARGLAGRVLADIEILRDRVKEQDESLDRLAWAARDWGYASADKLHITDWADWPVLNRLFILLNDLVPADDDGI